jgi:hypothetical protein
MWKKETHTPNKINWPQPRKSSGNNKENNGGGPQCAVQYTMGRGSRRQLLCAWSISQPARTRGEAKKQN